MARNLQCLKSFLKFFFMQDVLFIKNDLKRNQVGNCMLIAQNMLPDFEF